MHGDDVDRDARVGRFFEESEARLAAMGEALATLEKQPGDPDALAALSRAAHGLTAGADKLGFADLAEVARQVEDVIAQLRAGRLAGGRQVLDLLLASIEALREMLASGGAGRR